MTASRRALLASSAAVLAAFAGCNSLSAPAGSTTARSSSPTDEKRETREFDDANDNDCPDRIEAFTVDNSREEAVSVHVTVTRDDSDDNLVYENTFELSPRSSQFVDEPVFGSDDVEYHIEATYDGFTRRETIAGLPCEERQGRFVTVDLGQYSTFKIRVGTDGDYPP